MQNGKYKKVKLSLIDGDFTAEEAREVIMHLFLTKVQFHELKNFSSLERYGKPDETAQKRIPRLRKEMEKLEKMLAGHGSDSGKIAVRSEIILAGLSGQITKTARIVKDKDQIKKKQKSR